MAKNSGRPSVTPRWDNANALGSMYNLRDTGEGYWGSIDQYGNQSGQTRESQMEALGMYRDMAQGNGPSVAEAQLKRGQDQGIANAMALQAQGRGGNLGAQARMAGQAGAGMQIDTNQQAAALRAQEQQAAMAGLANQANTMYGQDMQAKLAYEQMLQANQMGMLQGEIDWRLGSGGLDLQAAGQGHQKTMDWLNWGSGLVGGLMGGASMMSDERVKNNVGEYGDEQRAGLAAMAGGGGQAPVQTRGGPDPEAVMLAEQAISQSSGDKGMATTQAAVADALANIDSYTYTYNPGEGPAGPRMGPMAQDLAAQPATAHVVSEDPRGMLQVDTGGLASLATAASADQERRLQAIESQIGQVGEGQNQEIRARSGQMLGGQWQNASKNMHGSGKALGSGISSLFASGMGGGGGGGMGAMMGGGGGGGGGGMSMGNMQNFAKMFGGGGG